LFRQILARSSDWHGIRHDQAVRQRVESPTSGSVSTGCVHEGLGVEGGTIGTLVP
jgi:hypothetical protein